MERLFSSRWLHAAAISAIVLFTLAAYSNTFSSPFQFDDAPNIVENRQIRSLSNLPRILRGQRGVTMATFALNYAIGGLDTWGYHAVNLAIHVTNAILAYFLIFLTLRLMRAEDERAKTAAAFTALLFALHPVQTQAVTYIVQRMESLSALFYLLSLVLFIKAAQSGSTARKALLYASIGGSYILGFHSKEVAFTMPAVLLLYDLYFVAEGSLRALFKRWPLYALLFGLLIFFAFNNVMPLGGFNDLSGESSLPAAKAPSSSQIQGTGQITLKKGPSAGFGIKDISPREYLLTQFNVLVYYITLLAVPVNQNLDYDYPLSKSLWEVAPTNKGAVLNLPQMPPVVPLVVLLAIIAFGVYAFMRSLKSGSTGLRVVSFFIFWFFIILSPTSSLMPILDVIFEHRLYLPSLGFFAVAVIAIDSLSRALLRTSANLKVTGEKADIKAVRLENPENKC